MLLIAVEVQPELKVQPRVHLLNEGNQLQVCLRQGHVSAADLILAFALSWRQRCRGMKE